MLYRDAKRLYPVGKEVWIRRTEGNHNDQKWWKARIGRLDVNNLRQYCVQDITNRDQKISGALADEVLNSDRIVMTHIWSTYDEKEYKTPICDIVEHVSDFLQ